MISGARFDGKTVLVTGGAGGIGLAIATRFAGEGARVVVADLNGAQAEAAAAGINETGGRAMGVAVDVSDASQVQAMVDGAARHFGGVDVAVCAAGRMSPNVDFLDLEEAEWKSVLDVNLTGAFLVGKAVARRMLADRRGEAIIHISSVGGVLGVPTQAPYCVSKAGLGMLTKVMALSLAPHGIRVNAVGPGPIRTAMTSALEDDPAMLQLMMSRTPIGRLGEPDEIASIVLFLASAEAAYIAGQTLYADGGRLALNYVMAPKPPAA
ncbi:MAG: short-chain dehydrogenase/reductase [Caulobacter sp.]|nr:short-chain dehydrogenase/reductase [Caulobacter sp.]